MRYSAVPIIIPIINSILPSELFLFIQLIKFEKIIINAILKIIQPITEGNFLIIAMLEIVKYFDY